MRSVAISVPYPLDWLMGNVVTAHRVKGILAELGYDVRLCHGWDGAPADLLVALHAVKSAEAVQAFRRQHPGGAVIVVMTGTDLYRDLPAGGAEAWRVLEGADGIVVTSETGAQDIPEEYRDRVAYVPKSLDIPPVTRDEESETFDLGIIGHLREVKNPFHVIEAVARHPEWEDVRVWQIGEALDESFAAEAVAWQARDTRYRWLGPLAREETLARMARLAVSLNSSFAEGASNAILESMVVGVPVLASRTAGAIDLLGPAYPGLFDLAGPDGLEPLLERVRADPDFREMLRTQAGRRARGFSREAEKSAWRALVSAVDPAGL